MKSCRRATAGIERQRGVAAIMFGIATLAFMTMVMFGFNVGQLYYAQRDLERQAGLAALAGAQVASGCHSYGVPGGLTSVTAAVVGSLTVNGSANTSLLPPTVELGMIDSSTGYKRFIGLGSGDIRIQAVRVRLTRTQPALIAPALFAPAGAGLMAAAATARAGNSATFTVGTAMISVGSNQALQLNSLLTAILGSPVSVSNASYNQLAASRISLANLMRAAGVSDFNGLLGVNTSLPGGFSILSSALSASGSGASAGMVSRLGRQARNAPSSNVNMGEILGTVVGTTLNPSSTDAASAIPFVSGSDFLLAMAQDAASKNPTGYQINTGLGLILPGIGGTTITLHVIHPPVIAVGPVGTEGKNSQLQLHIRQQYADSSGLGQLLALGMSIRTGFDLSLADGTGTLTALTCPNAANANPSASITVTSDVMSQTYGSFAGDLKDNPDPPLIGGTMLALGPSGSISRTWVDGPLVGTAGVAINANAGPFNVFGVPTSTVAPVQAGLMFRSPVGTNVFTTGTQKVYSTFLPSLMSSTAANLHTSVGGTVVSGPANSALSSFGSFVVAPIGGLMDSVIDPLLSSLGIQVGVVQINLQNITISSPVIETFCNPSRPIPGAAAC